MTDRMFRLLRADEIECRVSQIKENGLVLLLYKDARCDMNILDETVGAMNWQREHSRENANCNVGIWDAEKQQWIWKEDTGTESNTEAEKGLASDSFKRACVNWGIGRELYTAPFIWIRGDDCRILNSGGKYKCYDNFNVTNISYNGKNEIDGLIIECNYKDVFVWGTFKNAQQSMKQNRSEPKAPTIRESQFNDVLDKAKEMGVGASAVCKKYKLFSVEEMTQEQYEDFCKGYTKWKENN